MHIDEVGPGAWGGPILDARGASIFVELEAGNTIGVPEPHVGVSQRDEIYGDAVGGAGLGLEREPIVVTGDLYVANDWGSVAHHCAPACVVGVIVGLASYGEVVGTGLAR